MANFSACQPMFRAFKSKSQSETEFLATAHTLGKMVSVNVSAPTYREGKLYADNDIAEEKKEFVSADISLTVSTIPFAAAKDMYGIDMNSTDDTETLSYKDIHESNYGKFGYIYGEVIDGVDKICFDFYPRVKFDVPASEFKTKGENIEFSTPTLSGKVYKDPHTGEWKNTERNTTLAAAVAAFEAKMNKGTTGSQE